MKVFIKHGHLRLFFLVGVRTGLRIAAAAAKDEAAKAVLRTCGKDVVRALKRFKREYKSLPLAEILSAEGDRVTVKL